MVCLENVWPRVLMEACIKNLILILGIRPKRDYASLYFKAIHPLTSLYNCKPYHFHNHDKLEPAHRTSRKLDSPGSSTEGLNRAISIRTSANTCARSHHDSSIAADTIASDPSG